jgi:hydroxylamine reductase
MSMFCFQCQETAKGTGCTIKGVCGKSDEEARMMDVLLYVVKGLSILSEKGRSSGITEAGVSHFIMNALFTTITNANFDKSAIIARIKEGLKLKRNLLGKLKNENVVTSHDTIHDAALWDADTIEAFEKKADVVGVLSTENEDVRSLRELVIYGVKGMAAYAEHACNLGDENEEIFVFMQKALAAVCDSALSADELVALVLETGKYGVDVMALLDKANTGRYGNPEITEVNIGVRNNPGILISGHDLRDLEDLLEQTKGTGIDVYTHSEMLPAHYYPFFKKYDNFAGNYGNAWHRQRQEFETFNGPVLFTTNCIVPPLKSATYKERIYTTGASGLEGCIHVGERPANGMKDFSIIIEHAKKCPPPQQIEEGKIVGGFAHNQVLTLADKVLSEVSAGNIKKFVVMAGCDGRMASRSYYTEFAEKLPGDTVILTAGCAKYRYNKLPLGDINGIPRVLDAGQCNDSYSLAVIALKLKEVLGLDDVNKLPIVYNIAWYEQKAVIVLLSLLYLGVKNIHLGPTLPAFLSPNVAKVLVENFGISGITTAEQDVEMMMN